MLEAMIETAFEMVEEGEAPQWAHKLVKELKAGKGQ